LIDEACAELRMARSELERQDESTQRARLDGALLVARTAAHQLNNALSPIVGYAELLGMLPAVRRDPTARSYATLIGESASNAAELVQRLQRIVRLEETPSPLGPDKPLLDLDRSAS
jgi:signal transduction histidine kinase